MNGFWAELASCRLDEASERGWTVLIAESSHDVRAAIGNSSSTSTRSSV